MLYRICFLFMLILPLQPFAQSYKKIHRNAIVADTHNDVISSVTMKGMSIETDLTGKTHSDIARFKKGGIDVQVFSIFCNETFHKDTAYNYARAEIDSLYAIVSRNPGKMMIVTNPAALDKAIKEKKLACMMGVEGGHMINDRMDCLDTLFRKGVRYMTLTWNNSVSWASSAADESKNNLPFGTKGLTSFGKEIVKHMNDLGMMVDLSHVGEQTFWDAINTTTKPVIVSHSCAWSLCPVPRNLKDEQIKAVGKNGGVIDVNFYSGFLDSNYMKRKEIFLNGHKTERDSLQQLKLPGYEIEEWLSKKYAAEANDLRPPLSLLIDHIDHIVQLIGADHVGLGSDFDGIESAPKELNDVSDMPLVTKALLERGYSKKDVEKILGGNFMRVFTANSQ
ncbi:MAG TPA: dipeptidase [Chitinophagaceae bacterium]|nr:dipeptidase [Chitinophagaceae bacterium]